MTSTRHANLDAIPLGDITATDLRHEIDTVIETWHAYRLVIGKKGADSLSDPNWSEPEAAQMLLAPEAGRFGVAWGGDAEWFDMPEDALPEQAADIWLDWLDA